MNFEEKVENTIRKHNLIRYGDRVIIGVSGGADSVALLTTLCSIRHDFNMTIEVCHINHGLRPEAHDEQIFVQRLCAAYGIPFHAKEVDVAVLAKTWNMSTEEAGRKVRYDFFAEIANGDKIATAHHMNDNVETVLMRMFRGTGLKGLAGIPYQRENIIRPLLDVSRKEIEQYLKENYQKYVIDGSNLLDIYTRNKIRLNIIPQIESQLNPNIVATMSASIKSFREDADYFQTVVNSAIDEFCIVCADVCSINKDKFLTTHRSIQKRILQKLICDLVNVEVSNALLENLVDGCSNAVGTQIDINQKYHLTVSYKNIVIKPCNYNHQNSTVIKPMLNSIVTMGDYQIKITETHETNPIQNTANVFYLPRNLWNRSTMFRTRRNGDVLYVAQNMSKKLGRFFTDNKIDRNLRDNYWLLTSDWSYVYWIPGLFGGRFKNRTGDFVKFEIL